MTGESERASIDSMPCTGNYYYNANHEYEAKLDYSSIMFCATLFEGQAVKPPIGGLPFLLLIIIIIGCQATKLLNYLLCFLPFLIIGFAWL